MWSDEYALLLAATGGLFLTTLLANARQTWQLLKPRTTRAFSMSLSGEKTRSSFLLLLAAALAARLASITLWAWFAPAELPPLIYDSALVLPSLMFLTSFSVIALFWAQVYYTSLFMVLNYSQFLFWFLNCGVYSVVALIACMTRLLGALDELRIYNSLLLAALYALVGCGFGLYGLKVAFQFSGSIDTRAYDARRSAVVKRVLILSTLAPIAFWARAAYEACVGLDLMPNGWRGLPLRDLDLVMILLSEWLPAQLVLTLFCSHKRGDPPPGGAAADDSLGASLRTQLVEPDARLPTDRTKDILLNFVPSSMYAMPPKADAPLAHLPS